MQIGTLGGGKNGTWPVLTVNKRRCQNDGTRLLRLYRVEGSLLLIYYTRLNDWLAYISESGMRSMGISLCTAFPSLQYT